MTPPPSAREIWETRGVRFHLDPRYGPLRVDWWPPMDPWVHGPDEVPFDGVCHRFVFTFESCGWYNEQGECYEWWNVLCEGHIVGMLWYYR